MMQAHSPIPGSSTLDMHPDEHSHTSMSMDICDMQERYKSTPSERNLGNNSTTSSSASTPNKMRSASPPCHMVNFQSDGHAGHRSVVVSSPILGETTIVPFILTSKITLPLLQHRSTTAVSMIMMKVKQQNIPNQPKRHHQLLQQRLLRHQQQQQQQQWRNHQSNRTMFR